MTAFTVGMGGEGHSAEVQRDQEGSAQQFSVAKMVPQGSPKTSQHRGYSHNPHSSTHHGDNDKGCFNQGSFCQRGFEQFILVEANTFAFSY